MISKFRAPLMSLRAVKNLSRNFSTQQNATINPAVLYAVAGAVGLSGLLAYYYSAEEHGPEAPHYPWSHKGMLDSYDVASLRRGYEVYKNVCSTCHSMKRMAFRNLVGIFTEEEVKSIAKDIDVWDGPDDEGNMYQRPAKLPDYFPSPYKNEKEARAANNGALPPDMTLIVKARPGHEDYVFALLTGYTEPPAGVKIRPGLYYNPYFAGGAIGMAPPISEGIIEFADGTPATPTQIAKDVTTFLAFASTPEADTRKKMGLKTLLGLGIIISLYWYTKKSRFSVLKTRRILFKD